jgi:hypothetical protein
VALVALAVLVDLAVAVVVVVAAVAAAVAVSTPLLTAFHAAPPNKECLSQKHDVALAKHGTCYKMIFYDQRCPFIDVKYCSSECVRTVGASAVAGHYWRI